MWMQFSDAWLQHSSPWAGNGTWGEGLGEAVMAQAQLPAPGTGKNLLPQPPRPHQISAVGWGTVAVVEVQV